MLSILLAFWGGLKSIFELLRVFPAFVDGLLMAGGVGADLLGLLHRNGEMHTEMAFEIVVCQVIGLSLKHI